MITYPARVVALRGSQRQVIYGLNLLYTYFAIVFVSVLLAGYVAAVGAGTILRAQVAGVALATIFWGLWNSLVPTNTGLLARGGSFLAELVLLLAWYALLERMLRGPYLQSMPELIRRAVRWVWLLVVAGAITVIALGDAVTPLIDVDAVLNGGLLLLCLLAMVLAAQLYGEATVEPHTALRGFCFAAAIFAGTQAYLNANAVLLPLLPDWIVLIRNLFVLGSLALLGWCLQSNPQWSLAIFVSPQARVYAPRLLAAMGALLLVVLAVPLYDSDTSATSTNVTVALYTAGIGVLLSLVLFSERLRAQLRVFVSKHFLPFRYDYREEWLRLIDTLASPGQEEPLPQRAVRSLAQIVSSPAGLLFMRDSAAGHFACIEAWNAKLLADEVVAGDDPVIAFMLDRQWILDTAELQRRPELYPGVTRPAWLAGLPDALLIVPLISNEELIGFVILHQSSSAFQLTFEEIDLLRTSGRQVAAHLAQYDADRQLAEAKQFEAFNRLTAFVMHDLKNLIAQQSLMVKNAARHKNNPAFFEDAMATIENSVARMNKLLQQLQHGDAVGPTRHVNLASCVDEALRKCVGRVPVPEFTTPEQAVTAKVDAERLTSILGHLIRNAQEATPGEAAVRIELSRVGDRACIVISDEGCGMEEDFIRTRLFRPFDTTKGSQGMGIGAYQARSYVISAGGAMSVESAPGTGTRVRIELPVGESQDAAAEATEYEIE
ncbi:MAG: PEP-CTERM system histidine kinase PrsK [Gammaproteobacteria bacterium]|nr:PEP-CTERM system histidine kinase PrsK [Gammaproteobacteria bacterium]NND54468.1 PEP-CTERM system histidine kinase PrsK [Gammaproteobacteria bacterium]